ncbi:uncharacterized protein LOC126679879 [Mercurialis annua]|uniref:uncharacterized protein LOC126679879 n=1 Tax=Mercurialis annua TaxID=3986 RepID=UPI00215F06D0|nr:uncharacterized protein LOC126679879 [Mercurialis annua]
MAEGGKKEVEKLKDQEDYHDGFPVFNVPQCTCGVQARVMVAWTEKNPERRFFRCSKPMGSQCTFFKWYDEEYAPHLKYMLYNMKKKIDMLQKEGEKLRGDLFYLKYLSDHSSVLDAIAMENELKKYTRSGAERVQGEASESA